jgi:hypothetical protein
MSYRVENRFIGTLRHFNIKYLLINRHKEEPVTTKENEWSAACSEMTRVACGNLVIELQHSFRKIVVFSKNIRLYVSNVCGKYSAVLHHYFRKIVSCTSAVFSKNIRLYFSTIFGK